MMSERFDRLVPKILRHEGGYVNDPADPGGETKFGISKRAYPDMDIAALTEDQAIEIYRRDYWQPWMDVISDKILALQAFDFEVNAGIVMAARVIQRAAHVKVDGIVGPKTLAAIDVKHNTLHLRRRFAEEILLYYGAILRDHPAQYKFARSWFRRVPENITYEEG